MCCVEATTGLEEEIGDEAMGKFMAFGRMGRRWRRNEPQGIKSGHTE
jgi:hypothetical protein